MSTGFVYNREEYIEGMVAFGIPIKANSRDLQAAIWAVELTSQVFNSYIQELMELLKGICEEMSYHYTIIIRGQKKYGQPAQRKKKGDGEHFSS